MPLATRFIQRQFEPISSNKTYVYGRALVQEPVPIASERREDLRRATSDRLGELCDVVGGADQRPLCLHCLKATQQELSKSSCLLDLP